MSLSDFGVVECEGGACKVDFSKSASYVDIERDFRRFVIWDMTRIGARYSWGNISF